MTVDMETFNNFLHTFQAITVQNIDHAAIERLKFVFEHKINSKRTLESITDLNSLLKVLKKYRILQFDDISVLRDIAQQLEKKHLIQDEILKYEQWLEENSSNIKYLYTNGKSKAFFNNSNPNESDIYETVNCESLEFIYKDNLEEQFNENLKLKEWNSSSTSTQSENRNIFARINFQNWLKNSKGKKYVIIISVFITTLIIVIWILVKHIHIQSTAIEQKAVTEVPSEQAGESMMPYNTSNVNVGFSNETRFEAHYTQFYATGPTTISPAEQEKKLQNLVMDYLSEKIGSSWLDVSRKLNIQESIILDIETKYFHEPRFKGSEKMFKEVLKLYFSKHNPRWKIELKNALAACKRNDLKINIENIFEENS